jgi:hypothetical protein
MNPTDEMAVKIEPTKSAGAVAGSDDVRHKPDERLRAILKNLERTSDQRKPVEDSHSSDVELNQQLDDLPSKAREDMFYSKMMIKLLPMKINVESHKDVVYKSYHELSVAFANKCLSLEAIEKLKRLDLQAERPKRKMIEHDPK